MRACVIPLLLSTACIPLPIPHTETVIPAVSADFRAPSGRPARGLAIALTGHEKDTACGRAQVHRVTDAEGRIAAPATQERKSIFWLTLMENFGLRTYWLCTGRGFLGHAGVRRADRGRWQRQLQQ